MSKIDLHIHSDISDGSDSIETLFNYIKQNDIKIFALTDHDTVAGCEIMQKFVTDEITFIPSVELTCIAGDIKCHILGYNCDFNNEVLLSLIEKGKVLRRNKLETRINYLKDKWNIILNEEELNWLYARKSVVKTHIAQILVKRGLAPDNVSAIKKYLDGCKSDFRFSIEEAIDAIKKSGGIPIWAHPLGGEGELHDSCDIFIQKFEKMKEFKIEGLECYYSRYDSKEIEFLTQFAKQNGMLISGGSDYHGTNKLGITLAKLNINDDYVDSENLTLLNKI